MITQRSWIKNVDYRDYKIRDEKRIVNFFIECGYISNIEFWNWINRNSPYGNTIFKIAELDGKIICHYAVLPKILKLKNKEIKVGLGIHLASHPKVRSTEVVVTTMKYVYQSCKDLGIDIIFGFPNKNSWLFSQRLLGWVKIADISALEKPLGEFIFSKNNKILNVQSDLIFTNEHISLLEKLVPLNFITVKKNLNYLNWRYKYHPFQRYYLIEERIGDQIKGFFILKIYEKNNLRYGHILELGLLEKNDFTMFDKLLNNAISFFKNHSVDIVSMWMSENHPLFSYCKKMGFKSSDFITHFGYKKINYNLEDINNLNWFMVMGDSDAF